MNIEGTVVQFVFLTPDVWLGLKFPLLKFCAVYYRTLPLVLLNLPFGETPQPCALVCTVFSMDGDQSSRRFYPSSWRHLNPFSPRHRDHCDVRVFCCHRLCSYVRALRNTYWESTTGLREAKGLIQGSSARRTKDLLKLNRDKLRWVVGLFSGYCHLKGHLFKLGLANDPICERCPEEDESATHILCNCEAVAHIRFRHPRQFFMQPSDYYDTPIDKVLYFIRGVRLVKG
jgi:hypothetical protein